MPFNFADGIAVDKPEEEGLVLAKAYANFGITVNHCISLSYAKLLFEDLCDSYEDKTIRHVIGGSTSAAYLAIDDTHNEPWVTDCDIVIMLGCEGNVDTAITKYILN